MDSVPFRFVDGVLDNFASKNMERLQHLNGFYGAVAQEFVQSHVTYKASLLSALYVPSSPMDKSRIDALRPFYKYHTDEEWKYVKENPKFVDCFKIGAQFMAAVLPEHDRTDAPTVVELFKHGRFARRRLLQIGYRITEIAGTCPPHPLLPGFCSYFNELTVPYKNDREILRFVKEVIKSENLKAFTISYEEGRKPRDTFIPEYDDVLLDLFGQSQFAELRVLNDRAAEQLDEGLRDRIVAKWTEDGFPSNAPRSIEVISLLEGPSGERLDDFLKHHDFQQDASRPWRAHFDTDSRETFRKTHPTSARSALYCSKDFVMFRYKLLFV